MPVAHPSHVYLRIETRCGKGRDRPEDIFTGLEKASTLSWPEGTNLLFHVADAPCHGVEFHDENMVSAGKGLWYNLQAIVFPWFSVILM